jgi:hypothetical protein
MDEVKENIRFKILSDWSSDRGSQYGMWKDSYTNLCGPDWLKDPNRVKGGSTRGENQLRKNLAVIEKQKEAITSIVKKLQEPSVIPDAEEQDTPFGGGSNLTAIVKTQILAIYIANGETQLNYFISL